MLIVTPQVDWRRDGLPSPSSLRGAGEGRGGRDGREEGAEKRWEREILDVSEFPVLFAFSGSAAAEVERVTPTIILLLYFINYFWK